MSEQTKSILNAVQRINSVNSQIRQNYGSNNQLLSYANNTPSTKAYTDAIAEAEKNDNSFGQAVMGTTADVIESFNDGLINTIEGIGDYAIGLFGAVGSWFGADDQWATDIIEYDWSKDVAKWIDPLQWVSYATTKADAVSYSAINNLDEDIQNLIRGGASTIGQMVPQVLVGILTGGASIGAQVAMTSALGFGAGGNSIEEALTEGANLGQALGTGTLAGILESGIEWISGGIGGTKGESTVLKQSLKEILKNANEEGIEEVVSALVEPVTKLTYKSMEEIWDEDYNHLDASYWKNVLASYAGGALGGAFGSAVQGAYVKHKVGNIDLAQEGIDLIYEKQKIQNGEYSEDDLAKAKEAYNKKYQDFSKKREELKKSNPEKVRNLDNLLVNPDRYIKQFEKELGQKFDDETYNSIRGNLITDSYKDIESVGIDAYGKMVDVAKDYINKISGEDIEIEYLDSMQNGDSEVDGAYIREEDGKKKIYINKKYEGLFWRTLAHEGIEHATNDNKKDFGKYYDNLKEALGSKFTESYNKVKNEYNELSEDSIEFKNEVTAHIVDSYIRNKNDFDSILRLSGKEGLLNKALETIKSYFGKDKLGAKVRRIISRAIKSPSNVLNNNEYGDIMLKKNATKEVGLNEENNISTEVQKFNERRNDYLLKISQDKGKAFDTRRSVGALSNDGKEVGISQIREEKLDPFLKSIKSKLQSSFSVNADVNFFFSEKGDVNSFTNENGIFLSIDGDGADSIYNDALFCVAYRTLSGLDNDTKRGYYSADLFFFLQDDLQEIVNKKNSEGIESLFDSELNLLKRYNELVEQYGDESDTASNILMSDILSTKISYGKRSAVLNKDYQELINDFWKNMESDNTYRVKSFQDNQGNALTPQQIEAFKGNKNVEFVNGKPKTRVVFNATDYESNSFSYDAVGKGAGWVYGAGFYFSLEQNESADMWGGSGARPYYVILKKPLSEFRLSFKENDFQKIADRINNEFNATIYNEQALDELNDSENDIIALRILANKLFEYYKGKGIDPKSFAGSKKTQFGIIPKAIFEETGYDGLVITKNLNPEDSKQLVAFNNKAIKSITNLRPDMNSTNTRFKKHDSTTLIRKATRNSEYYNVKTVSELVKNSLEDVKSSLQSELNKTSNDIKVLVKGGKSNFTYNIFENINLEKDINFAKLEFIDNLLNSRIQIEYQVDGKTEREVAPITSIFKTEESLNTFKARAGNAFVNDLLSMKGDVSQWQGMKNFYKEIISLKNSIIREYKTRVNAKLKLYKSLKRTSKIVSPFKKQIEFSETAMKNTPNALLAQYLSGFKSTFSSYSSAVTVDGQRVFLGDRLEKLLSFYNEEKWDDTRVPFNEMLRNQIETLKNDLDINLKPLIRGNRYPTLNSHQIQMANSIAKTIAKQEIDSRKHSDAEFAPRMQSAVKSIKEFTSKNGKIYKILTGVTKPIASSGNWIFASLGRNALTEDIVTKSQVALNNKRYYVGEYNAQLEDRLKELSIKDSDLTKLVNFNGVKVPMHTLLNVYIQANTEYNSDLIRKYSLKYKDDKSKVHTLFKATTNEESWIEFKNKLNELIPANIKELGNYFKENLNGVLKDDYSKWYTTTNGGDAITVDDYYEILREQTRESDVTTAVSSNVFFAHSINRKNSSAPVMAGNAFNQYVSYIDELGKQMFIVPTYKHAVRSLNYIYGKEGNNNLTVRSAIPEDVAKYISNKLKSDLGVMQATDSRVDKLVGKYSTAVLGLNLSTPFIQYASIITSNLANKGILKGTYGYMFDKRIKQEIDMIIKGKTDINGAQIDEKLKGSLGGFIYRSADNPAIVANTGLMGIDKSGYLSKFNNFLTGGIRGMDKFTIRCGLATLMYMGETEGYKIGTYENVKYVAENWNEFELSQIGTGGNSMNALKRGDYGSLLKTILSPFQGANTAIVGNYLNRIALREQFKNSSYEDLKSKYDSSLNEKDRIQSIFDKKIKEYEEAMSNDELSNEDFEVLKNEVDELTSDLSEAKERYYSAKQDLDGYEVYRSQGGKRIILRGIGSVLLNAIFLTLVKDFFKRLYGKKEWKDSDLISVGNELLLNATVNWIPALNTIVNSAFNGYDVSNPSTELINSTLDAINSFIKFIGNPSDDNQKRMMTNSLTLVQYATGMPIKNGYNIVYGITNSFEPDIAVKLDNIFYSTSNSQSSDLSRYIKNGEKEKVNAQLGIIMESRVGKITNEVQHKLTDLCLSGYTNVLPNQKLSQYNDDEGNVIKLDKTSQMMFNNTYSKSNTIVDKAIKQYAFKTLEEEEQSKAIKAIYNAYYESAKAKAMKDYKPNSKLGTLVNSTSIDISNIASLVTHVKGLEADAKSSKKQLATKYINQSKTLSKQEKLLCLYLSGYSLSDDSKASLKSYLISKGMNRKEANDFLKN